MRKQIVNTSQFRRHLARFVRDVLTRDKTIVLGRRNEPQALLIKYPRTYNPALGDMVNVNAYSSSFDFLEDEPELYVPLDVKKRYAE